MAMDQKAREAVEVFSNRDGREFFRIAKQRARRRKMLLRNKIVGTCF